jgi:hypothetical protein
MTRTMMDRIKARILGSKQLVAAIALCTAGNATQEDTVLTAGNITKAAFAGGVTYAGVKAMTGQTNAQGNGVVGNGGISK